MRQKIFILVVGIVSFLGMSGAVSADIFKAKSHLDEGDRYYFAGRFKDAAREYEAAWISGKIPEAAYYLGVLYDVKLNNNEKAVAYYYKYISIRPGSPEEHEVKKAMGKARKDLALERRWRLMLPKKSDNPHVTSIESPKPALLPENTSNPFLSFEPPPEIKFEGHHLMGLPQSCLSCHSGTMGPLINMMSTHPTGRIPTGELEETVPKHVRFYKEGRVVCLSCHNPENIHFEQGTPGKNYKVLRVDTGPNGEELSRFCAFCHSTKSAPKHLREGTGAQEQIIRRR